MADDTGRPKLEGLRELNDRRREFCHQLEEAVGILYKHHLPPLKIPPLDGWHELSTGSMVKMTTSDFSDSQDSDHPDTIPIDDIEYTLLADPDSSTGYCKISEGSAAQPPRHPLLDKQGEDLVRLLPNTPTARLYALSKQLDDQIMVRFLAPREKQDHELVMSAYHALLAEREKTLSVLDWLVMPEEMGLHVFDTAGGRGGSLQFWKNIYGEKEGYSLCTAPQFLQAATSLQEVTDNTMRLYSDKEQEAAKQKLEKIWNDVKGILPVVLDTHLNFLLETEAPQPDRFDLFHGGRYPRYAFSMAIDDFCHDDGYLSVFFQGLTDQPTRHQASVTIVNACMDKQKTPSSRADDLILFRTEHLLNSDRYNFPNVHVSLHVTEEGQLEVSTSYVDNSTFLRSLFTNTSPGVMLGIKTDLYQKHHGNGQTTA